MSPLVEIGLTVRPKTGEVNPTPLLATAMLLTLVLTCRVPWQGHLQILADHLTLSYPKPWISSPSTYGRDLIHDGQIMPTTIITVTHGFSNLPTALISTYVVHTTTRLKMAFWKDLRRSFDDIFC